MLENRMGWRTILMSAMAAVLLLSVSCSGKDSDDDDKPSLQSTQNYDRLKLLVEECDAARQEASSFTAESFAAYSQALEAARQALKSDGVTDDAYAEPLENLKAARSALAVTGWNLISDFLPQCSMLMVLSEDDMPLKVAEGDRLGAFYSNKCLGIASPELQPNGKRYFFLQILQDCADEYNNDIDIVLKYHSAQTNFIYRSSVIKYVNQGILGSYTETCHPDWQ